MPKNDALARPFDAADLEHGASLVTGASLLLYGLAKGGIFGLAAKVGGIALLYRGQQGYRRLHDYLGHEMPLRPTGVGKYNVRVESVLRIERTPEDLYRIWRRLENLPIYMSYLKEVKELDDKRSAWTAEGPAGIPVKWDAEIVRDVPGEIIAWRSLEGSNVDNAGSLLFERDGGATRLRVVLRYDPPAEGLGTAVARIFGRDAQTEIDADLRRFKRLVEARDSAGGFLVD